MGVTQEKLLRWGWGLGRNDECWVRAPHTFLCCVTKEHVPGEEVRMRRQQSIQRVRQIIWLDCLPSASYHCIEPSKTVCKEGSLKLYLCWLDFPYSMTAWKTHQDWGCSGLRGQTILCHSIESIQHPRQAESRNQGTHSPCWREIKDLLFHPSVIPTDHLIGEFYRCSLWSRSRWD